MTRVLGELKILAKNKLVILSWAITFICVVATTYMGKQHTRIRTHIMNINDGLFESNAPEDTKERAHYLASRCFVNQ